MMAKPKSEIIDQLVILAEAYGLSFTTARMDIYAKLLSDLPIDKLKAAIIRIIKTRTFGGNLPTVAEIREAAEDKLPIDTRAAIAWDKFRYVLRHHCPYDSVAFDDPIISHIITVWGDWPSMGDWPADTTHYWRKEFCRLYEAYVKSDNLPPGPRKHIGLTEYENCKTGFVEFIPKTVYITWDKGEIKALPMEEAIPRVRRLTKVSG